MTCPYQHPECEGVSGLFFGFASCWPCFVTMTDSAYTFVTEGPG